MPNTFIILSTILVFWNAFGQFSEKITINWKNIDWGNNKRGTIQIPGFDLPTFQYTETQGILYANNIEISGEIAESSIKISHIQFEPLRKASLLDLNPVTIPTKLNFTSTISQARNKKGVYFSFSPILRDGNTYKRVRSFRLSWLMHAARKTALAKMPTITNSVLATGNWFRFAIGQTGVYRLTADFLKKMGINLDAVDPRTIKIYGQGGHMLPLVNEKNKAFDPSENAIRVLGEADGRFDAEDAILFYGIGLEGYNEDSDSHLNLYSDVCYYYLTYGANSGKRIGEYRAPTENPNTVISTFTEQKFYEVDSENLVQIGRRWYGDRFDITTTRSYNFSFQNLVFQKPLRLKISLAAISDAPSAMRIETTNNPARLLSLNPVTSTVLANRQVFDTEITATEEEITIDLTYDKQGNPAAIAYLDYIQLTAERTLRGTGKQFNFYSEEAQAGIGVGSYAISDAATITAVWDVTNISEITSIPNPNQSESLQFNADLGVPKRYVAVVSEDYYAPTLVQNSRIANQNLKGTIFLNSQQQTQDFEYLFLTTEELKSSADRLAAHHRLQNGLKTKVVTLNSIYNEFSEGKQDIVAIRNFVRYVYENASEANTRLQYLCLLGDASFDYKNRIQNNTNIVPTFESLESFSLVTSFASDDFFGCLDPQEGSMIGSDRLDIAIGRILADSPQLASEMVDKIIAYDMKSAFGRWRNNFMLIADDVDEDWEETIQGSLEQLGNDLQARKPFFNFSKIYTDAFLQESSAAGDRYPKVNTAITNGIESGALVVNYFGHGGEDGLAKEFVVNKTNIRSLNNTNKYPLAVTVTCEFTKFDNPLRTSAGELLFWNKKGGSTALVTTTREVIVTFGISVNDRLTGFLFPDGDEYPSIAEAVRLTKNSYNTSGRRVIFFFGDPAMKLAIPKPKAILTHVNDKPISAAIDTLKALSKVKLTGAIVGPSGNLQTDYQGIITSTIFDKEIQRKTLANDGTRDRDGRLITLDYKVLGPVVFRGKTTVNNGIFTVTFVVPKDIGIEVDQGKASFYAEKNGTLEDQTGENQMILIGDVNPNAAEDTIGPELQVFLNEESFVTGGITNDSPILLVKLKDENGINTSGGIGHDLVAVLDGNESKPIVLNSFYETELDDFTQGSIRYPLKDLSPGEHHILVKAWDVYNNLSTQEIRFQVIENGTFTLRRVLNYPNPFVSHTEFWFEHSSTISDMLEVQISVFTVSGKIVWNTSAALIGKTAYREEISWNGRDDFGDKLAKGVYVYKINVKSALTNQRAEKIEKLVIL